MGEEKRDPGIKRIEAALVQIGSEHQPPVDWKQRTRAALDKLSADLKADESAKQKRRQWRRTVAVYVVLAFLVVGAVVVVVYAIAFILGWV